MNWYRFKTRCPKCDDKETIPWRHNVCSSIEEINENGEIRCLECDTINFIEDFILHCRSHHEYDPFPKESERLANIIRVISLMPEDGLAPIDFVNKIIQNIIRRCRDRFK